MIERYLIGWDCVIDGAVEKCSEDCNSFFYAVWRIARLLCDDKVWNITISRRY